MKALYQELLKGKLGEWLPEDLREEFYEMGHDFAWHRVNEEKKNNDGMIRERIKVMSDPQYVLEF